MVKEKVLQYFIVFHYNIKPIVTIILKYVVMNLIFERRKGLLSLEYICPWQESAMSKIWESREGLQSQMWTLRRKTWQNPE